MTTFCHRCHGQLPAWPPGDAHSGEEGLLFCPHCAAPQLLLPEHMRSDATDAADANSTGTLPPPAPAGTLGVDWRVALPCGAGVAAVAALLMMGNLKTGFLALPSLLWTISGSVIALGLYARARPKARMDGSTGLRIGVATGLLMISAMGVALAATGVVERFALHGMASFDAQMEQQFKTFQTQMTGRLNDQGQGKDVQAKAFGFLTAPEVRSGFVLVGLAGEGAFLLILSAVGGAFAGALRRPRPAPRPAE